MMKIETPQDAEDLRLALRAVTDWEVIKAYELASETNDEPIMKLAAAELERRSLDV